MDFLSNFNRNDFFGRDGMTMFLGQVEDVNDPKMSGRVRVRAVGWHPKDKQGQDSVKVEDLPWAHVAMPTTHAQQARIGGKHGLLPGCWVLGFYMDGPEAQIPVVLNTINFTAKSTSQNNKKEPQGKEGTLYQSDPTFANFLVGNSQFPNTGRLTTKEQGGRISDPNDPAGNTVLSEADGTKCGGEKVLQSQQDKARQDEYKRQSNPSGQKEEVLKADGACGDNKWATEDTQRNMKEKMPSANDRFIFNDVVWNNLTGQFINLNGTIQSIACALASKMIQPAMAKKSDEEEENRKERKQKNKSVNDRDGKQVEQIDDEEQRKDDEFHAMFMQMLIDMLCSMLGQMIRDMDRQSGPKGFVNPGARCVAEQIVNNVESLTDKALRDARDAANNSSSSGFDLSALLSMLGSLRFNEEEKYATREPHNRAGKKSQDKKNRNNRCNDDRKYNTELGNMPSFGFGGGGGGGSSSSGSTPNFGGTNTPSNGLVNTIPCKNALKPSDSSGGGDSIVVAVPLPSKLSGPCADSYKVGTPNTILVLNPGHDYYYYDDIQNVVKFPKVYIRNYSGTPIPVVDRKTGEIVLIITSCPGFNPGELAAPVTIVPPDNEDGEDGFFSDQLNVRLDGFFIQNTGFGYCEPSISIIDKDTGAVNGKAVVTVSESRIVNIEVTDRGNNFTRIPEVIITDDGTKCGGSTGNGAVVIPIMTFEPLLDDIDIDMERDVIFRVSPTSENGVYDTDGNKVGDLY
jgi:hypothetical protein